MANTKKMAVLETNTNVLIYGKLLYCNIKYDLVLHGNTQPAIRESVRIDRWPAANSKGSNCGILSIYDYHYSNTWDV